MFCPCRPPGAEFAAEFEGAYPGILEAVRDMTDEGLEQVAREVVAEVLGSWGRIAGSGGSEQDVPLQFNTSPVI